MNLRLTSLSVAGTAAVLSILSACSEAPPTEPGSGGAAGTGAAGKAGGAGVAGGGAGGTTAGASGGGAGGTTAGVSGGGAGGSTAGLGGGGTAGSASGSGGQAGGASGSGSGGTIPATFDTLKLVIEYTAPTPCMAADCHGGDHHPLKLALDDGLYSRLTTYMSVNCGNIPIVTPGDPSRSALVKLLKGPCGMTPRMPNGCTEQDGNCLPAEYIAAIEQWVANGAPPQ
jgi:hypothetical protein